MSLPRLSGPSDPLLLSTPIGEDVYPPSEDTYLMLDTIAENTLETSGEDWRFTFSLEVGSGSGVLSSFLLDRLAPLPRFAIAVDLNPLACKQTVGTASRVGVGALLDVVCCDFTKGQCFRKGVFNVVICNPPYVPGEDREFTLETGGEDILEKSWNGGGPFGREVPLKILHSIFSLVTYSRILFLFEKRNDVGFVLEKVSNMREGLAIRKLRESRCRGEELYVYEIRS